MFSLGRAIIEQGATSERLKKPAAHTPCCGDLACWCEVPSRNQIPVGGGGSVVSGASWALHSEAEP